MDLLSRPGNSIRETEEKKGGGRDLVFNEFVLEHKVEVVELFVLRHALLDCGIATKENVNVHYHTS